ncbi:hypothetical protein TTHERM_00675660 (macronuclear) [Tetrahymena thermophila SB210]|uniref:Uncharacterized protein n=1 Tax=Tetrahymena thermophila (strain SB210) TaxID=312017 RepID=Q23DZ4_TETTS|nr:hypothetical protein TTHERM_00675660 [Tetrahymena thermophila SB210]EAR94793.2 hypothetical protein TTHERM_00675660 [Tetrahymena thermophila SB210]|eukprot:XP_001015038.2 hypothetical protein TTHERM_00675660 [Tetrahymena thermophila SB210]
MNPNYLDQEYNLTDLEEFLNEQTQLNNHAFSSNKIRESMPQNNIINEQSSNTLLLLKGLTESKERSPKMHQQNDIPRLMKNFEECLIDNNKIRVNQVCDFEEMQELIEQVTCTYCKKIAENPKCCQVCNQIYCFDCALRQILKKQNKGCMNCKSNKNEGFLDCSIQIEMIFDLFTIQCSNKGCMRKFQYTQKEKHMSRCKFRTILCTNKTSNECHKLCNKLVQYCDLEKHIRRHHIQETHV